MRSSVSDSVTGSGYSNRVSCWTSMIMDSPQRILVLNGPADLRTAFQDLGEECRQVALQELIDLAEAQLVEHPAQRAVGPAELAPGRRPLDRRQGLGRRF